jgi:hypothetical protein
MPGPWGPPPMMYPPCPPWAGWYGLWAPPSIPFHPGWLEPVEGFGSGGFYAGDDHYGYVGHQQDRGAPEQENRTVRNAKSDHPVSQGAVAAPSHWRKQKALKDGPSADQPAGSQGRTGPRNNSSTDGKAKPNAKKSLEEVAAE